MIFTIIGIMMWIYLINQEHLEERIIQLELEKRREEYGDY